MTDTLFRPTNVLDVTEVAKRLSTYERQAAVALQEALNGNFWAQQKVKQEALTSSDFAAAFVTINQYILQSALRTYTPTWTSVAAREVVDNLKPVKKLRLGFDNVSGTVPGMGGQTYIQGTLPRVGELGEYQTIAFSLSSTEISTAKSGIRIAFSWEAFRNDEWSQIERLPEQMFQLATNTDEVEIYRNLFATSAFNTAVFPAGNNLSGNPALTLDSLTAAIQQASIAPPVGAGDPPIVNTINRWALVIPQALLITAKQIINATQVRRTDADGNVLVSGNAIGDQVVPVVPPMLSNVTSASYLTSSPTGWCLVPYQGKNVYGETISNVFLRGNLTPELRIRDGDSSSIGGGRLSPYDGSFEADDIQLRMRYFVKGVPENTFGTVYSKGTGVAGA